MTERLDYLNPDWVVAAPFAGSGWIAGFVFDTEEEGKRTMRAIAELCNAAVRLAAARGET